MENRQNKFITVLTTTYPTELAIIRGRLESEGIECFIQDELTAQVNPFYSNAIGGVKLQVKESDAETAVKILHEGGYIKDSVEEIPKFITNLDTFTSKIPLLNKMRFELRLMVLIALSVSVIASIVLLLE